MRFYIKTFGCQMNIQDSRSIENLLISNGHKKAESIEDAQIAIVNSCTIREKPWHKAISETGRLRTIKNKRKSNKLLVGLVGCVAQQEGENIFNLLDSVDFVVSPDHYHKIPSIIEDLLQKNTKQQITGFSQGKEPDFLSLDWAPQGNYCAFVNISKGCNERCHYCIVPSVRGPQIDRAASEILKEVQQLVINGVKEITLLGQKVNAYDKDGVSFADLLELLNQVPGLKRLRFTSPHPRHMTNQLIEKYSTLKTLCNHIHLPIQSGSNRTLKKMGRRYTKEQYIKIVEDIRKHRPHMVVTTDLIVGFPGETREDFQETIAILEQADIQSAFSFKFSPRPGTKAATFENNILEEEKENRLKQLHQAINSKEELFRANLVGKNLEVLVETKGRNEGQLSGRAENFQIVNFTSKIAEKELLGQIVQVEIKKAHPNSLEGILL